MNAESAFFAVFIVLLVSIIAFSLNAARIDLQTQRQQWRIARIERKIDLVMRHLGVEEPGDSMEPVRTILASGNKIAAINAYREQTDAGLKEAKDAVEAIQREMGVL